MRILLLVAVISMYTLTAVRASTPYHSFDVFGRIGYTLPDGISQSVLHYARIVIYDINPGGPTTLLGQDRLDHNGSYRIRINSNEADGPDIRVIVYTIDDRSVRVAPNISNANSAYAASIAVINNVTSNIEITGAIGTGDPNHLAWYIYDIIAYKAWHFFAGSIGWQNNNNVAVQWSSTSLLDPVSSDTRIWLNRVNAREPDVILHEYGHVVMYSVYDIGTPPDPNNPDCRNPKPSWAGPGTTVCAWIEGWPTLLQGAIQNHSRYGGTFSEGATYIQRDMEHPFPYTYGPGAAGAVSSFLWDIYDRGNETCDRIYNSINGFNNNGIWKIFSQYQPTGAGEFKRVWIEQTSNGFNQELTLLGNHHGIGDTNQPCKNRYTYIPLVQRN